MYALWVAGLPVPDAGVVPVGPGVAEVVGLGVGVVVGVALAVGVGGLTVGVSEGSGATMPGAGVVGTDLAGGGHVELGDGVSRVTFPPGVVLAPPPAGNCWPEPLLLPLLLLPPVPPPLPVPPDEDEVMLEIACRTPGIAAAVPANRKMAATARTGRSQAVPNRW